MLPCVTICCLCCLGFVVCVGIYVLLSACVVGSLSLFWLCLCVLLLFIVVVSVCFVALRLNVVVGVMLVVRCVVYGSMFMLFLARC